MQVISQALGASSSIKIPIVGTLFRLMVAPNIVTVRLFRRGRMFAEAVGILPGYWSKPDEGFDEIEIATTAAQTVVFGVTVGTGGYDRAAGDVNITGSTAPSEIKGPRVLTGALALTDQPIISQDIGFSYGLSAVNSANNAAGTAVAFITPAANVNGAIIWAFDCWSVSATQQFVTLLAKTSAPTTVSDGDVLMAAALIIVNVVGGRLARPVRVAAGKGVYVWNSTLETAAYKSLLATLF